ncbi:MAG TPA: rhodanese-like domain-containing protein [bacterium]|nr:rhodanese-like domain-containing protein [bacterium]HXB97041.1 rhodanese-like domain-containing protein [bacterium]
MQRLLLCALTLTAAGLGAYGVSPSQYTQGRAQDSQAPGQPQSYGAPGQAPSGPQPVPMPGNATLPGGGPVAAQPAPTPDFDAMAIPDWAKAWKHYHWDEAKAAWEAKDSLFIDARAKSEYDQGHIPGAIPLPLNPDADFNKYFDQYASKIKSAKHLITYCHGAGCQLSNKVAQKLWDKGYHNVGSFFGGWPQWNEHQMPVETGGAPKPR